MRDVVKTNVKREQNSKRKRRRRRHLSFYFFLVIILVVGIGVLLSITLLFNIKNIVIKGDVDYTDEDIIRVSGISVGDNLVRLDSKKASNDILSSMIFIEKAEIDKQYPDTIVINVSRCVATADVEYDGGYLIVSANGKILGKTDTRSEELLLVEGFEPSDETLGTYLKSTDPQKDGIFYELFDSIKSHEDNKIVSFDISDKYDININYGNKIIFDMGNSNDITYKLELAATVLDDLSDDKEGYLTMIGTNQISFRDKSDADKKNKNKIPIKEEDMPSTETASGSDNSVEDGLSSADGYPDDANYDNYEQNDENNDNYD